MNSDIAPRARARELAAEYIAKGNSSGWFEQLYREAKAGAATIPWADRKPNPNLTGAWPRVRDCIPPGTAGVIGCGLGDDAEWLSQQGFDTVAFDIAPSAIGVCLDRFPATQVRYAVADLLNPPAEWAAGFDFVLESYTLQVLPSDLRKQAMRRIADLVRPGGSTLIIARAREESEPAGQMPWPLTRNEINEITNCGLSEILFDDYYDDEIPRVRRFRALYRKNRR